MENIKECIWMKAKEAVLTSLHVFIMWAQQGYTKKNLKNNRKMKILQLLPNSQRGDTQRVKSPPASEKMEQFKTCYTGRAYKTDSPISVILMLWNISNASLLAFCEKHRSLSLLYNEPWSLLDRCALSRKDQCFFSSSSLYGGARLGP